MGALVAAFALLPLAACARTPSSSTAAAPKPSLEASSSPRPRAKAPLPAPKAALRTPTATLAAPKVSLVAPKAADTPSLPAFGNIRPGVASPTPPPSPAAVPSAAPVAAARPSSAPHGPAIYAATVSPKIVHNGEAMTWAVRTTADVVSVTAHVSMYTLPLHREKSGLFILSFTVPSNVPGIFHGTYSLNMVAQDGSGTTATRTLPLVFQ